MLRDFSETLEAGHLGTVVRIRSINPEGRQMISVWFDGRTGEHDLPAAWVARADPATRTHMTAQDRRLVKAALASILPWAEE